MILSDSKPILFMILLLVDVERLRDAMPTDGAHCGVHSSIHLLQLSFTERLHLLLLFLLFHILNDLNDTWGKYSEYFTLAKVTIVTERTNMPLCSQNFQE